MTTTYAYDNNGNLLTETTGSNVKSYVWDADNRLRQLTLPGTGAAHTYEYDANGLRVSSVGQPPAPATPASQWAVSATASSQYTANSYSAMQATGVPDTNACGDTGTAWAPTSSSANPEWLQLAYATPVKASGVRIHETYSAPFVTKVELVDTLGASHVVWQGQDATACGDWLTVTFPETAYDVAGVRISTAKAGWEEIDAVALDTTPPPPLPPVVTRYLLDGPTVLEELDSLGNTTASYLNNPQAIDEILSFTKGGATYYPLTDALGSVVALTDSGGAIVKSCTYDVYGARACTGSGPDIAFGFTGREHDASGLRYHRDRYADPATGRWQQADRLGMVDGPNRYLYVRGNPVRFRDPLGRDVWVEGASPTEPLLHQSVCSGDPTAGYRCFSFGVIPGNAWLGAVYEDFSGGGEIVRYASSSADQDAEAIEFITKFQDVDNRTRIYGATDTCRSYSNDYFDMLIRKLGLQEGPPPLRTYVPVSFLESIQSQLGNSLFSYTTMKLGDEN